MREDTREAIDRLNEERKETKILLEQQTLDMFAAVAMLAFGTRGNVDMPLEKAVPNFYNWAEMMMDERKKRMEAEVA